ncbi:hypothetical protein MFFDBJGM_03557 [Pectobacterium versatile]|nr:hypothetical protein MFFDBJGM_03557 [Pectobacterium versatile]
MFYPPLKNQEGGLYLREVGVSDLFIIHLPKEKFYSIGYYSGFSV